jgi:alkanesulfonate monooxygenase SsuD/methylene tetrahydromethanopterin reductase-like flavin-dependent oxidoreductase (luciferase family)
VQLSALVSGNTYRNPTLLAKAVTALDVISGGRAVLGIGAGWFELEHQQLGYEFGTFTDRFARLDEALSIIEPMLRGERPTVDGKWYRTENAMNEPRIRDDLPIMLGGSGEKKTFGLAARHAQHINIICDPAELPRKLDALAARCAEIGRDRSTLETSFLGSLIIDEDGDRARELQKRYLRERGVDTDVDTPQLRAALSRQFVGNPDEVAAAVKERILDPGIDGIIFNMPVNGHLPGVVALAGKTLAPLVS